MNRRRIPIALALAVALPFAAIGAPSGAAATKSIKVDDNFFSPKSVTVAKNTKVVWRFVGDSVHNVTSTGSKRFKSSTDKSSGTYAVTFKKAGVYNYVCSIHDGMKGKVTVR